MEYLLGSLITFIIVSLVGRNVDRKKVDLEFPFNYVKYRQSDIFSLVRAYNVSQIFEEKNKKNFKNTQSYKHFKNTNIKVIIMDDIAYWIKDNLFYTANVVDGIVDKETTRTVDTMHMDKVQLDKMMFIIDQLREENTRDSGSAGN
jgi:hypothetical protein